MIHIIALIDCICIILFIFGFIGNFLGLIVFSSRRFRCCSTYTTLALTLFTINLICSLRYSLLLHSKTRRWLSDHVVNVHWSACKVFRLTSSFRILAAWVTVFWAIERFIYVSSRLNLFFIRRDNFRLLEKYKYFCMIFVSLFIILIVTGPNVFFSSTIKSNINSTTLCTFVSNHTSSQRWERYFSEYSFAFNYNTIRFLLSELIPSILVAIFNIGIILCILRTTARVRRGQKYQHNKQISMSAATGITSKSLPLHFYDIRQHRTGSIRSYTLRRLTTASVTSVPYGKMSWMNAILILHSILFFLSSSITSLVYYSTSSITVTYWISVVILANCSLNFYVYCLSGQQFRTELKRIGKRYLRNLHKALLRRCYKQHNRRHSTIQNGKDYIQQQDILGLNI